MELRQLKYFLSVADNRSFVGAANELFISRQAVSKAIGQLEEELNTELFMRDTSGAFLSPAGLFFYERIRGPVTELMQAQTEMQQYGVQFHQVIRIAFSVGTLSIYEHRIQKFIRDQTNIVIEYWESDPKDCEAALVDRRAELAVSIAPFTNPQIRQEELLSSPFYVVLKEQENLEVLDSLDMSDLQWTVLACLRDGQSDALCLANNLKPQYIGTDVLRLLSMAQTGLSAVLLPEVLIPEFVTGICRVPLAFPAQWRIHCGHLASMDNNLLYQNALDELLIHVFDQT